MMSTNEICSVAAGDVGDDSTATDPGLIRLPHKSRGARWAWIPLFWVAALFIPGSAFAVTASISVAPATISEDGEQAIVTVDLDLVPFEFATVTVNVAGTGSTATLGQDYEVPDAVGGLVTLNFVGSTSQTFAVASGPDGLIEGPETAVFVIEECTESDDGQIFPCDGGVGDSATLTIVDSTTPAITATIVATDPDASKEGPDPGSFSVRLTTNAPYPGINVSYEVGGTAVPGQDYRALTGDVFIPQGQSSATIVVHPLTGSGIGYQTVVATLASGPGYEIGQPSSATVTITDAPDAVVDLSIESGAAQVASTGQPLQPFVVRAVLDGGALAGIPILWTLETGEGTLSAARSLTNAQGLASSTLTPSSDGEFVVRAQVEGSNESVAFTALFNPLSSLPGLTANQRAIGTSVQTLCPRLGEISQQRSLTSGEQDLLTQCNRLIASSVSNPSAAAQGIVALTPDQASAPRKMATQVTGAQLDNVATRLTALRRGAKGISLGNLTVNVGEQSIGGGALASLFRQLGETGGAASADDGYEFERLGVFVNGNIDWGDHDRTGNEDGFDFKTLGITAGLDYRFLEGLVLGVALGYGDTDLDIDANGGELQAKAWTGMVYGTYYATDHFYLEGSATYGWGDYDQTRNIAYSLLGGARQAKADFDGSQYAFMLGAGYDLIRGEGILDLYGQLRYLQAELDAYRESGASGLDLDIGSQEATSFNSVLGVNYTRSISTAKAVLVPQGWLEWAHEFDDGDEQVTGVFANDPSRIPFALATDRLDSDYFRVGLGVGAQFGQGRTAFVSYEAAIGLNNYTEQTATLGVRLDF